MAAPKQRNLRTVAVLSVAAFGVFAVLSFATAVAKGDPLGWGFGAISGGFALMGLSLFSLPPADARGRRSPGATGWVLLVLGAAVMSAGPLIMHGAGVGWGDQLGSGRRSGSLWLIAALVWGGAGAIWIGAARAGWRALRDRRAGSAGE